MRTLKNLRGAAALLIGAAALVSCNNEEFPDEPGGQAGTGGDIRFEIGFAPQGGMMNAQADGKDTPQTRVSTAADFTSKWESGDAIGIFAVANGQPLSTTASDNHIHNVKLTYNGTSWNLDNGVELWWPGGGGKLDFYAYYPYDDNGNSPATLNPAAIAFNVKADQSAAADYSASDLLTAKADNNNNGYGKGSTVSLQFSHALAMVQVSVPSPGKGFGPGKDLTVTLRGVKPGATLNLANISATTPGSGVTLAANDNDPQNITMYRVEQSGDTDYETKYTYRALVPAQTVAEDNSLFLFEHEERQILTDGALAQAFQMTAGQAEKFERTLPATLLHTVPIPAGTFLMGSSNGSASTTGNPGDPNYTPAEPNRADNETQHKVTLTKDFRMSKYQITNAQYAAFLNAETIGNNGEGTVIYDNNGSTTSYTGRFVSSYAWGVKWDTDKWVPQTDYENHPVINVTWYGAVAYCEWLTEATGIEYRLPTEAQWEYACRGGKENHPFGIGDGYELNNTLANFYWGVSWSWDGSSATATITSTGSSPGKTQAVGNYPANAFGLYDMHGNVFEWCLDQWNGTDNYSSLSDTDPLCTEGLSRVLRGGSWSDFALNCRSAFRYYGNPDYWNDYVGFRVAFVP